MQIQGGPDPRKELKVVEFVIAFFNAALEEFLVHASLFKTALKNL